MRAEPVTDMVKTLSKVTEYWISDPRRTLRGTDAADLPAIWASGCSSMQRMQGEPPDAGTRQRKRQALCRRRTGRRTRSSTSCSQVYLDHRRLGRKDRRRDRGPRRAHQAQGRLLCEADHGSALADQFRRSPTRSFTARRSRRNGENLVRGMKMLAEDIVPGGGDLKLRQTDMTKFAVGRDMALTAGQGDRRRTRSARSSSTSRRPRRC